jgi:cell division protein FtsN
MREKQLHLFDFEEDKKRINRRPMITLPLDTCILGAVIVILLFVFTFSLGVEKGRKTAFFYFQQVRKTQTEKEEKNVREIEDEKADSKGKSSKKEEKTRQDKEENIYVIQVASYIKKDAALKEAERLQNKGYPVLVLKKGKYLVIFVGEFKNKKDALKNMELLKKRYKDCFIRRL